MKYLYFAAALALIVLLLAAKSLYSDNQQLKEDKTKLEQSLTDAQSKNASLNETISKQAETQQKARFKHQQGAGCFPAITRAARRVLLHCVWSNSI